MFSGKQRRSHFKRSSPHLHLAVEPLEVRSLMASGVTEFSSGITSNVGAMTLANDGIFWFDAQFQDIIGSFDPVTEQAVEYRALPPRTLPHDIIIGPDGNLWFAGLSDNIGTFDITTKTARVFRQGITPGSEPHLILTDPTNPNYMWFTEQQGGRLARFDRTTQQITEFPLPTPNNGVHGFAVGADGKSFWFVEEFADKLGRLDLSEPITPANFDSHVTEFVGLSPGSGPDAVVVGPDGNIYMALSGTNSLGKFDVTTGTFQEFPLGLLPATNGANLETLIVGPDQQYIYVAERLSDQIGRYNIATGEIDQIRCGITPHSGPVYLVNGPDGNIWFTEAIGRRIARLNPTEADLSLDPNRCFVDTASHHLIGREPDPATLERDTNLLAQQSVNRFQIAQALLNSREGQRRAIQNSYLALLGRSVDPRGLKMFSHFLRLGGQLEQVQAMIVGSPEYFLNRGGGTNAGFLAAASSDLLGRSLNPGDSIDYNSRLSAHLLRHLPRPVVWGHDVSPTHYPATFDQAAALLVHGGAGLPLQTTSQEQLIMSLETGTHRSRVAADLIYSTARASYKVQETYGILLYHPPDPMTLNTYVAAMVQGVPLNTVLAAIVGSPEYYTLWVTGPTPIAGPPDGGGGPPGPGFQIPPALPPPPSGGIVGIL